MNFSCVFLLALALFGAVSQGYIASGSMGYGGCSGVGCGGVGCGGVGCGGVGCGGVGYGGVGGIGYNGIYDTAAGGGYGAGYGAGYETAGYGCRTTCSPAAVCDNCQCLKTIVRPGMVERLPYACSRRVQSANCRTSCGMFSGAGFGGVAGPIAAAGAGYGGVGGTIAGAGAGYMNGGYMY